MTIPDYQTLMRPILELAADQEVSISIAEKHIIEIFSISNQEASELLPSGKERVVRNRVGWAKTYLSKAGLLQSSRRGWFSATDLGRKIIADSPTSIDVKFLMNFDSFRDFRQVSSGNTVDNVALPTDNAVTQRATPEEVVETAYKAFLQSLRADLLDRVLLNSPAFFEQVIVELLVAMGYGGSRRDASEHLGRSGDGGIDGVIKEDVLGLDRVYVQAKRYARGTVIGRPDIQGFVGSLVGFGATKGVFVTTSGFSTQAVEYAARIPQRVILIDGDRLTDLMVQYDVGVRTGRVLAFKRLDEDFFAED